MQPACWQREHGKNGGCQHLKAVCVCNGWNTYGIVIKICTDFFTKNYHERIINVTSRISCISNMNMDSEFTNTCQIYIYIFINLFHYCCTSHKNIQSYSRVVTIYTPLTGKSDWIHLLKSTAVEQFSASCGKVHVYSNFPQFGLNKETKCFSCQKIAYKSCLQHICYCIRCLDETWCVFILFFFFFTVFTE